MISRVEVLSLGESKKLQHGVDMNPIMGDYGFVVITGTRQT